MSKENVATLEDVTGGIHGLAVRSHTDLRTTESVDLTKKQIIIQLKEIKRGYPLISKNTSK